LDTNPGITGPIYDFIGDITTLESFSVTYAALTGTIPTALGQLVDMQQVSFAINMGRKSRIVDTYLFKYAHMFIVYLKMWLYANNLSGDIPTELGLLSSMALLQVEGNEFVGSMPEEICANTVSVLTTLGADCLDSLFNCSCCTCCSLLECGSL
jgi:hypothetical protein